MTPCSSRIATVDALRGIAAFGVAWFHFTNLNSAFLPEGFLKSSGRYGWLGVEMFFVISGFVIPHALYRAQYQLPHYGRFLAKRIIRLDPPYLADICLVLALAYVVPLAPQFRGGPPMYSFAQLLGHLGYVNSLIGKPWVNPVFWTLGIEFQYYLLIGLIFPVLVSSNRLIRLALMLALLLPAFFAPRPSLIFTWLPFFVAGILTFQKKVGHLSDGFFATGLAVVFSIIWAEAEPGLPGAIVADCTGNRVRNAALQPFDLVRADELLLVPCACSDRRKSRQSWSTLRPRIVFGNYSSISRMLSLTLRRISVVLGG